VGDPGPTGYDIATGTYEQAREMIGHSTEVRFGEVAVNVAMIRHFAAMIRDGNAGYWDDEFAAHWWGGVVSPPGMLMTWVMPIEWRPDGALPQPLLTARVPLPGDTFVNASNDTEFYLPIREGDRLSVTEELVEVSPSKRTALGTGHFVTTRGTYRRQDGAVVARSTNVLFRFSAGDADR
jgi:acyl dehydratase